MEIYERIRYLRKNYLKLSQAIFGEKLGVSRDVIKNIELNTLARPEQKLSLIKLMCKEFGVNEEWLINGTAPMLTEPETFSLEDYLKKRGMTALELEIVKAYFELEPVTRKLILDHFKNRLTSTAPAENPSKLDIENAEAEYIKSCSHIAESTGAFASNISGVTDTERMDMENTNDKAAND